MDLILQFSSLSRALRPITALPILVSLLLTSRVWALDPQKEITQYGHTVWGQEAGLPENISEPRTPIVQTKDGYIWLCTSSGPVRFDGLRFELFSLPQLVGIRSAAVFALAAGHDGSLWIGTGDGLVRYKNGHFKAISTGEAVFALAEDRTGNLWLGTSHGLMHWKDGRSRLYTTKDGLPSKDSSTTISAGPNGDVWLTTQAGLTHYSAGKFVTFTTNDGLSSNYVTAILEDHAGQVWAGAGSTLHRLVNGHFVRVGYTPEFRAINALTEDRDGNLWIGTKSKGLVRYSKGRFTAYEESQDVRSITEDSAGGLWVRFGTRELHRLSPGAITTYSRSEGLESDIVNSITQDREGAIWIGTADGLSRYQDGHFRNYSWRDGLRKGRVFSTWADTKGNIWVGTESGLSVFRDGHFFNYGPQGHGKQYVLALYQDRKGDLWETTDNLLNQLRDGKVIRTYGVADGFSQSDVRTIAEDLQGNLWIGSVGDGVFRLSQGKFTQYTTASGLPSDVILSIYADKEGAVWIGTDGSGIARYKNGQFTTYNTGIGLYDDVASQILEDDAGRLWITSSRGLYRVEKSDLNEVAENKRKFVRSVPCAAQEGMPASSSEGGSQPNGWKASDGRIWFPTKHGVAVIDPRHKDPAPPRVLIEEVSANARDIPQSQVRVPPGEGRLEFHYTALNYNSPKNISFRYKLEGFDKEWIDAGQRRSAYYTNVGPGNYTFRVTAANPGGVWNETAAAFPLDLEPHFYQTYWFLILCVLGAISICTSAYRLRIAQVRRREVELQRLLAQGAKELQERKRVEAELRRSEDKFAKAFHSSPASMGISSPETGRLIDVNKSFLELFGFQHNEVIGHTASELGIWADPAEREQVIAMLRQQGTVHNLKTRLRNRAGKILDASISAEIVSFGGEECLLVVTLDVTQQRRLEDQLRQAQKMEAIGNLAGGVAHDFNNLLNIISGYTELMLYQLPTDTPLHAHAQNIRGASDKAASLTRQLLAFSRKQMVSLKVLELDSVLREAGELLPRLIAEDIELSIRSAPEARVRIDPVQIQQIIFNLAVNARDAMPTGGHLIIETRCLELNGDFSIQQLPCPAGRYVLLSVCDTGVGIPEDMQPHIFEPFFTSKEQGKGTGLGLATVYGIVQQAGGGISVHSEPGAGTTFKIYLPSVEEPLEPAVPEYSEESLRGTETILLVEDQTELRSLMSVFLENQGYTVIQASRPSEALELIGERKQEIDLLLTDVVMPGMHGPELAQRVRRLYPQIKILFVSGYAPDRFDNKLHGDFALLQKPIGLKALSQKLREALTSDGSVKFYEQDSDASAA